jgi:branched-chain amino acid transport system substrate-binding protein
MYPDTQMRVPGNVFYNGYMATRELLAAIERAGSTNNIKVIKQLEGHKMSAKDRMQHHDALIDPATHQVQQTIYLATANAGAKDKDDMFKIVTQSAPADVLDAGAVAACKMESYDATPNFDA